MKTYEIEEKTYTLHIPECPKPKNSGQFRKGMKTWNKGMTWDEMGMSKCSQEKIRAILAEGRKKCDHHKCGGWNAKPIIQMDEEGNKIGWFYSSRHAAERLNLIERNIRSVCEGKRPRCGGFKFKFDPTFL